MSGCRSKRKGKHPAAVSPVRLSHWLRTDVGRKREINEDFSLAESNLGLYMVADGMGGHAGGDTASRMAVKIVRQHVLQARRNGGVFQSVFSHQEPEPVLKMLDRAVRDASARIYELSSRRPELEGMGTTATLLLVHGLTGYVAHVGDSRLYRLRNQQLDLLTDDHSLVNEQVKAGFLTKEEAAHSRFSNIITRSVGFESEVTPDVFTTELQVGDIFLLCSDGLNGMIPDEEISGILSSCPPSGAAATLVAAANRAGGDDNITAVMLRVGRRQRGQS
ncbi:MAG: Stp1/IreP family PP2C-type Ser/Thr phosphatase [Deltaproteobacteria bacterium]|nr:MAG: Stp1/IreP family PP2C-type Ser/Thr phosphatase [Deltaproteobacteria bacterium]